MRESLRERGHARTRGGDGLGALRPPTRVNDVDERNERLVRRRKRRTRSGAGGERKGRGRTTAGDDRERRERYPPRETAEREHGPTKGKSRARCCFRGRPRVRRVVVAPMALARSDVLGGTLPEAEDRKPRP